MLRVSQTGRVLEVRRTRHRKPLRLKQYDYSQPGAYFVTICTQDRVHRFGEIVNGEISVNGLGAVVRACWDDLPNHYTNIRLDEFVIMPNHVHGIIVIVEQPIAGVVQGHTFGDGAIVGDGSKPSPTKKHTLSEIVRGFKTFSSRRINELANTPGIPLWQRGFHDHIVRDDRSLDRIREYIASNPQRWETDAENVRHQRSDEPETW